MISIVYEGNNQVIDLVNTPNLVMTGYDGLDQPSSEIITLSNPSIRGTQYQRSQVNDRSISFAFTLYDVENTRYQLMQVFKSGEKGTLTLKSEFREGQIDCYFEEMTFSKFNNPTTCVIFLRAPYPYFEGIEDIIVELSNALNMFVLETYIEESGIVLGEITGDHTATLINSSDIQLGLTIDLIANDTVTNPIVYNVTTNKFIGINRTMVAGEKIVISTGVGKKKVTSEISGTVTNIMNTLARNSTFFGLQRGSNEIKCDAESGGGNMVVYLKYRDEYEAI